jgi:hypothetical protein
MLKVANFQETVIQQDQERNYRNKNLTQQKFFMRLISDGIFRLSIIGDCLPFTVLLTIMVHAIHE